MNKEYTVIKNNSIILLIMIFVNIFAIYIYTMYVFRVIYVFVKIIGRNIYIF